jgi:hypothetical protein
MTPCFFSVFFFILFLWLVNCGSHGKGKSGEILRPCSLVVCIRVLWRTQPIEERMNEYTCIYIITHSYTYMHTYTESEREREYIHTNRQQELSSRLESKGRNLSFSGNLSLCYLGLQMIRYIPHTI